MRSFRCPLLLALLTIGLVLWPTDVAAQDAPAPTPVTDLPMRSSEEARVSPNAMVGQTIGTTDVIVTYGRPSVRDREVYGGLVPYGEVWRTGANEATTLSVSDDVTVAGEPLPAGTYSLFTIPGPEQWTVIFNEVAAQWGAYDYDASADVLRVTVTPEAAPSQEQLAFRFEDVAAGEGSLVLHWADVQVPIPIAEAGE